MRFALIGAAGYIAPSHMEAIQRTGNDLIAALDPHDSVGILDRSFPRCRFFQDPSTFCRFIEGKVDFVSVCSPNSLHPWHCRLAMEAGADVICEKPLVLHPDYLDVLSEIERSTQKHVNVVLQLRHAVEIEAIRRRGGDGRCAVEIEYVTPRGPWYEVSWKGNSFESGGLLMNIGIHLFDLVLWLFGAARSYTVDDRRPREASGTLILDRADVRWRLSLDRERADFRSAPRRTFVVDTHAVTLGSVGEGAEPLHTVLYREVLMGRGLGISDSAPAIHLAYAMSRAPLAKEILIP